jgi:hypothetical protein
MPRSLLVRIAPFWILVLIIGSLSPRTKDALGTSAQSRHRICHFLSFGSTALLLVLVGTTAPKRAAAALSVIGLGVLLEFWQHSIGGFRIEWWDIRDDTYAAIAAWLIGSLAVVRHALVRKSDPRYESP